MGNFNKVTKNVALLLGICIVLLCLPIKVNAADSLFSVSPFHQKDQVISGKIQPNDEAYLQFKHQLFTVKSNAKGEFSLGLKQPVGNESIVLFQKDTDGFEQKTIVQTATDANADAPNPKSIVPPSYLGIQDNQFVFESHSSYRIYVIYEGKTYSGLGSLLVPKNKSNELKFFGQDDSHEFGKKSKVVVKQADESETLKISSFDVEGSRLRGTAWPYGHLKIVDNEGNIKRNIELEADGNMDVHIPLSPSELEEGTSFTVQDARSPVPLFNQKIQISSFVPSKEKPIYFTHDVMSNTITGKTYSDAQVQLDHQVCSSPDTSGMFTCSLAISEDPTHQLTVIPKGKPAVSVFFDTDFNTEAFPFSLTQPLSSNNAELNGTTLPNKELKIEASNGLSVNFNSDATGAIKLKLPNAYNLSYQVFLKGENDSYHSIKYLNVDDDREIPEPILKFQNGELVIFNPLYGKDADLKAELLIEKPNGEWDLKQLTFDQWTEKLERINVTEIQDGDRYTLTLFKKQNDPNSRIVKGVFKRIMKPKYDLKKSDALTLVGQTDPFAKVMLNVSVFRNYESSYLMRRNYKAKADAKGNFKIILDKKQALRIDYSANITSTMTSKDGLKNDYYYQTIGDSSFPRVQLASKYIADSDPAFNLLSDDRLKKIEIKYFSNNKLVTEKVVSPVKYLTFIYTPKKQTTYKENTINKIMVRATNVSQQTSPWSTFKVTNTDFPKVQLQKVYVGDKEIKGKNSNKKPFEIIVNDKNYVIKPLINGTFKVKLATPVKKGTKTIKIILKNEVNDKQTLSEKVWVRKK
ncbi:hypothetical protein QK289_15430 [Exiguobacterium antarcticum]|uniref:Bacterial Ig domain-containing protein n=1 Tax=Exiguobacterium antarcticum TaxID=132920 RepID=A0ABT6R627_9BACL|nr:hypothetical protein [Exiguobacterium antarcticum]MDI3236406.1 hypothetical protein [Exiguobacterium antarcticum]